MTTATPNKTPRTLIAAGTSNAAGGTTRGVIDLRTAFGGLLTIKLINGATGPTVQAVARVLVAHTSSETPTPAGAGSDWKTITPDMGNGVANNAVGEWSIEIDQSVMHLEVEVTGNTGQAVGCEAYLSELTSFTEA